MPNTYSDCFFCGGEVTEERISREIWWKGQLYLVRDVPAGVCRQCGQKVVLPAVAKEIDKILGGQQAPQGYLQVPSFQFPEAEAG